MIGLKSSCIKTNQGTFWPNPVDQMHKAEVDSISLITLSRQLSEAMGTNLKQKNIIKRIPKKRKSVASFPGICRETNKCQMTLNSVEWKRHEICILRKQTPKPSRDSWTCSLERKPSLAGSLEKIERPIFVSFLCSVTQSKPAFFWSKKLFIFSSLVLWVQIFVCQALAQALKKYNAIFQRFSQDFHCLCTNPSLFLLYSVWGKFSIIIFYFIIFKIFISQTYCET